MEIWFRFTYTFRFSTPLHIRMVSRELTYKQLHDSDTCKSGTPQHPGMIHRSNLIRALRTQKAKLLTKASDAAQQEVGSGLILEPSKMGSSVLCQEDLHGDLGDMLKNPQSSLGYLASDLDQSPPFLPLNRNPRFRFSGRC
jgi:hypothetical protein